MRKSFLATAAGAAALIATFVGAEETGINALVAAEATVQTQLDQASEAPLTDEVVPVFVEAEVVQDIPEEPEESPAEIAARNAGSLRQLVAEMPGTETMSEEMRCLAGAVYFELRGEALEGQLAVAQVIINRSESQQFPASYCGVVYQRSQFSFVRGGSMPSINTGSTAWKRAKAIAQIAHQGLWESEVDNSLYFHARYVKPGWARKKVARAQIDTHIFYR